MKNKAAQELAKKRWSKTTPEERKAHSAMMTSKRLKGKKRKKKGLGITRLAQDKKVK